MPDHPSINERVARACGISFYHRYEDPRGVYVVIDDRWREASFNPELEAADAVLAAERFGLFSGMRQCELEFNDGRWFVYLEGGGTTPLGEGTFCQSICQSILRLAEGGEG